MVKSFKYILTRVLIGVGIAIVLMSLKGGLVGNVYAQSIYTIDTNLSSMHLVDNYNYTYNFDSGKLTGLGRGELIGTLYFTDYQSFGGFNSNNRSAVPRYVIVQTTDSRNFACNLGTASNPMGSDPEFSSGNNVTNQGNTAYTSVYSLTCPIELDNNVSLKSINVAILGANAYTYVQFGRFFTFSTDTGQDTINSINDNTNAINDTNSILEDNNVSSDTNSSLESMLQAKDSNTPVADLLLLPLTLFNAYLTGFNGSCASFNLGTLFNHQITLPCINLGNLLGSTLWSLIDVIFCLFMIFNIAQLFIYMFESITSLEDPYRDVYVPKHTYQPKHGGDN